MKRKTVPGLAAIALMTMGGCAASTTSQPDDSAAIAPAAVTTQKVRVADKQKLADDGIRCQSFQPTGSHRIITRCTSAEQRELEEDAARRTLTRHTGPTRANVRP